LVEKNIPYEKFEVDLANRPDWFVKDSPLGKIPLLYVGDKVLFGKYAGQTVKVDGEEVLVIREEEILAVVQ